MSFEGESRVLLEHIRPTFVHSPDQMLHQHFDVGLGIHLIYVWEPQCIIVNVRNCNVEVNAVIITLELNLYEVWYTIKQRKQPTKQPTTHMVEVPVV